jgi:hypothetical protein
LSRQELAEAANALVYAKTGIVVFRDGRYIGRLERGLRHWPQEYYRAALRTILGAATDADLGFTPPERRSRAKADPRAGYPTVLGAYDAEPVTAAAVRVLIAVPAGAGVTVACTAAGLRAGGAFGPASQSCGVCGGGEDTVMVVSLVPDVPRGTPLGE